MDEKKRRFLGRIVKVNEIFRLPNILKMILLTVFCIPTNHIIGFPEIDTWLAIIFFVICMAMFVTFFKTRNLIKEVEINPYDSKIGSLRKWYDLTYSFNKKNNWVERVNSLLKDNGIHLSEKEVVFSPSGNKGRYEKQLAKQYPNTTFYITDLYIPDDHEISKRNFVYLDLSNNALHISSYLKKNKISKIDMIWDIKGAIWYNYTDDKEHHLTELLSEYYKVLSDNGVIVIDAYKWNIIKGTISEFVDSKKSLIYYREESTYHKIRSHLNEQILQKFNVNLLEDGICSIAVLSKNPIEYKEQVPKEI